MYLNKRFLKVLILLGLTTSISVGPIISKAEELDIEVHELTSEDEIEYPELVPIYYQNNYRDVTFGDTTIAQEGNLVTCLAMLESYYKNKSITPDIFVATHSNDCIKGIDSLNSNSIAKYANYYGSELEAVEFDFKTACEHIKRYQAKIILKIPHNSVLGNGTSYILLTGISENGIIVRDPNKDNIESYGIREENGEYSYEPYLLSIAASRSSVMYILE